MTDFSDAPVGSFAWRERQVQLLHLALAMSSRWTKNGRKKRRACKKQIRDHLRVMAKELYG